MALEDDYRTCLSHRHVLNFGILRFAPFKQSAIKTSRSIQ